MVMKYLYDTNTFIYHFADETLIAEWFREDFLNKNQIIISTIVKMELLCYPRLSVEEEKSIREFLKQFDTIFINTTIEELTVEIRKEHKIKLPDAIIAATSLAEKAILVTRNIDDFTAIPSLNIINPFESDRT